MHSARKSTHGQANARRTSFTHCAKWLRFTVNGNQVKQAAGTRTWGIAERKPRNFRSRSTAVIMERLLRPPFPMRPPCRCRPYFNQCKRVGASQTNDYPQASLPAEPVREVHDSSLEVLSTEITVQDVIEYRATWKWNDLSKIKAQQNLRGFLRTCLRGDHRTDVWTP